MKNLYLTFLYSSHVRLPDVLKRQGLSLNLLSKHLYPFMLEKHLVVLEYFSVSLKILEQL